MQKFRKPSLSFSIILMLCVYLIPQRSIAATKAPFSYAGWIPFWQQQDGALDAAANLEKLREVSPFSYEVKSNGLLVDKLNIDQGFWPAWLSAVHDLHIKIIPTVAWFDGGSIHKLLSNTKLRQAHEDAIAALVQAKKFDGIDIDYEAKLAETKDYFSIFLKGLALRLHPKHKSLVCTIEARMPLSSIAGNLPPDVPRANDYVAINKYCDEVRVMAYDQGLIDIKLDATKGAGALYAPVADPDWVSKVLTEAIKTISRQKIVLGIPTYGYEYQITWANGALTYQRLRSHTFIQAMDRADMLGIAPQRNNAGELSFTYVTSTVATGVSSHLTWTVSSTAPIVLAAAAGSGGSFRYVSFSDAESAAKNIAVAKKFGIKGAVFFKLDGDQDPGLWGVMK